MPGKGEPPGQEQGLCLFRCSGLLDCLNCQINLQYRVPCPSKPSKRRASRRNGICRPNKWTLVSHILHQSSTTLSLTKRRNYWRNYFFSKIDFFQKRKCFISPVSPIWEHQHMEHVRHKGECNMFWENSQFSNLDNVSRNFFIFSTYNQSQEKKTS